MSTLLSAPRRRRRAALAAVLSLIAVPLVASSTAEAADTAECEPQVPCVIVKVVKTIKGDTTDVTSYAVNLSTTQPDLVAAEGQTLPYTRRARKGGTVTPIPGITQALSIKQILASQSIEVGEEDGQAKFSETRNARNVPSVLAPSYLNGARKFPGDVFPAVYVTADGRVGYLRPLAGTSDINAADNFIRPEGAPLVLTIHVTGDLLTVRIKTSPSKVTTSTPVSFSAEVEPASDGLSYRWNFTGGTSAQDKTATPSHTYKKSDTYAVNLEVRGDDGSYGRAATTNVKVGKPPKPPSTTGGGGTGGGGGGVGGGSGGGGGGAYVPPYVPTPPSSDNPPSVDTPPTNDLPTTPVDDGLQEVEGFVLAGAGAEQGDSIPGTQASVQPTKASELSTSRKISGAVIGALAVILLLGLGAEIETRWASTRLAHLRRRA